MQVIEVSPLETGYAEIFQKAEELLNDPQLFRKKIDTVNRMGLAGERLNIGCVALVYDSSLVMSHGKPRTLAGVLDGPQGTGKSITMKKVAELYPENRICRLARLTHISLYRLGEDLSHKILIIEEAQQLLKEGDAAATIRVLISEGEASYQKSGPKDTIQIITVRGPVAFLTTTNVPTLEEQLSDRLIKIHSDASPKQTLAILESQAFAAAGGVLQENSEDVRIWQAIHDSLEPNEVVIPFAQDLMLWIGNASLPLSARRAFERVLKAIMAMTVTYQKQREVDAEGRLVSEIADYAMAYQLVAKSFMEDIGLKDESNDERINLIKSKGKLSVRALAELVDVSRPAITDWAKSRLHRGVLEWCDKDGRPFESEAMLKRAKHAGDVYLRIPFNLGLPTPYELTADQQWKEQGELFELYDLGFEMVRPVSQIQDRLPNAIPFADEVKKSTDKSIPISISNVIDLGAYKRQTGHSALLA